MTQATTSMVLEPGEVLFTEGEEGSTAYFIRKGIIAISQGNGDVSRVLARRGPGEIIGEMALASGAPRSATAKALTECTVMAMPKGEVERRIENADPILRIILLTAFDRLRDAAEKSSDPTPTSQRSPT